MKQFSIVFLVGLVFVCNFSLNAQVLSSDKNNPTALKSNIISGKPTSTEATYYYSFFAGPGAFEVTMQGKANRNSSIVEATLFDSNKKQIGLIQITPDSSGQVKSISRNLSEKQKITLRLELDPVSADNVTYQIALEGAVSFSGGVPNTPSANQTPENNKPTNKPTGNGSAKPSVAEKITKKVEDFVGKTEKQTKSAADVTVFRLTPRDSFNNNAALTFMLPDRFSGKDNIAVLSAKQQSKIALAFAGEPGIYFIYLEVEKKAGSGNAIEVTDMIGFEKQEKFFKGNGKHILFFVFELTGQKGLFTITADKADWNFYGVEVKK